MAVRLVLLDLDGTLLTTDKRLTERTRNALSACLASGIQIVPATGRTLEGIPREVLSVPGLRYAIVINGAAVIDRKEDKVLLHRRMDWNAALKVIEIAKRYPAMYDAYIEGRGKSETRFLKYLEEYFFSREVCALIRKTRDDVKDLEHFIKNEKCQVEKLNLTFKDQASRRAARAELEAVEGVVVTSSIPSNLEINEAGAAKGSGLTFLAKRLQLDRKETMAFGDGENDYSMIKAAGTGIAMANAGPFLKSAADYVTASNDEDGVAKILEEILQKQSF